MIRVNSLVPDIHRLEAVLTGRKRLKDIDQSDWRT